jgi:hypothetical protein
LPSKRVGIGNQLAQKRARRAFDPCGMGRTIKKIGSWIYRVARNITIDWSTSAVLSGQYTAGHKLFQATCSLLRESTSELSSCFCRDLVEMKLHERHHIVEKDKPRNKRCEGFEEDCEIVVLRTGNTGPRRASPFDAFRDLCKPLMRCNLLWVQCAWRPNLWSVIYGDLRTMLCNLIMCRIRADCLLSPFASPLNQN